MHKKAKNADESNIPITQGMVLLNNLNIKRYRDKRPGDGFILML